MSLLVPPGVSRDCDPDDVERVLIDEAIAGAREIPGLLANKRLRCEGIELTFPIRTLHQGAARRPSIAGRWWMNTKPFMLVRVATDEPGEDMVRIEW